MKPHSLRLMVLALAWIILGSASIPPQPTAIPNAVTQKTDPTFYYWYLVANDSYQFYQNTADEITDIANTLGLFVDTNSFGDAVVKGYINNVYPHNTLPAVILYSHN